MVNSAMPVLVTKGHPARQAVEALIAQVYAREYGATVTTFADLLIALPDLEGGFRAAAGLRIGDGFFSETYLDQPIEHILSKYWQPPATRSEIAEVTTLAASHPNASLALISGITGYLRSLGVRFAFFTVTERLGQMLKRVGVPAQTLADARADRVTNPQEWGLYYATNPKVMAIHDAFVSVCATLPAVGTTAESRGMNIA
jgi:hypothetical protein